MFHCVFTSSFLLLCHLAELGQAGNEQSAPAVPPGQEKLSGSEGLTRGQQNKLAEIVNGDPKGADNKPLKGKELMKKTGGKLFSTNGKEEDLNEVASIIAANIANVEAKLKKEYDDSYAKNKGLIDKARNDATKLNAKPLMDNHEELDIAHINAAHGMEQVLVHGDVSMPVEGLKKLFGVDGASRTKRQAYYDSLYPSTIWKTGVYWNFDAALNQAARSAVLSAIAFWQQNTCIRFYQADPATSVNRPVIVFYAGSGCFSPVGRSTSSSIQYVSIGTGCESVNLWKVFPVMKESLGLWHAQSRFDRSSFVTVDFTNIMAGMAHNYDAQTSSTNNNYGLTYDYRSVMHYRPGDFAANTSKPVMYSLNSAYQMSIGYQQLPSFTDIAVLNKHYSCYDKCNANATVCYYGGFPNPNSCTVCQCPSGFGGNDCSQRQPPSTGLTCGTILTSTTAWQYLTVNNTVGTGQYVIGNVTSPLHCTYHITAPTGYRIQYAVVTVGFDANPNALCYDSCYYGGLSVKGLDPSWRPEGMRFCCSSQYNQVLTTASNRLVLQPWNLYHYTDFKFDQFDGGGMERNVDYTLLVYLLSNKLM
uniref:Zinc metalloproteinase n=1 Tax=Steinernema glaseri TaxID=37863 RepID=A0A1I8AEU3_9BILA